MLNFAPHIHSVAIASDLVMIDVRADRYHALPGAIARVDEPGIEVAGASLRLFRTAASALADAGILVPAYGRVSGEMRKPSKQIPSAPAYSLARAPMDVPRLASAVVRSARRLRSGLPCSSFFAAGHIGTTYNAEAIEVAVERYRRAKLILPTPTRCLPSSLAAAMFLSGLGIESQMVFGVRTHPFEAHCWLECAGIVLNDGLERVSAFTPIAVGNL